MLKKIKWNKPCLFIGSIMTREGLALLKESQEHADLIEIRYDALYHAGVTPEELIGFLDQRKNRVLLTLRTTSEGGFHSWKSTERVNLFMQLINHVDVVDLEVKNLSLIGDVLAFARQEDKGIILSSHAVNRKLTYGKAVRILEELREYRVQAYKIASLARTKEDLGVLVRLLLDFPKLRLGVMAIGPKSEISRVVLPHMGSKLVYGYLDAPSAKGQPSFKEVVSALPSLVG
ncbi:MAG: type I 3-dehydroquinate dehydratase [Blastochloris sp.]|nr:type I 3-dehydroquinate dehydratase [Blastochloris sp.]